MANIFHIERADNKITLGATGTTIYIGSHTASKILALDASKELESVTVGTGLDYTRPNLTLSHLGIEALIDPGVDKILFWDDSATACKWLGVGNSVAITDVTIDTIQDIRTTANPTFAGLTLVRTGAGDATQIFETANHQVNVYLDESLAGADTLVIAGQTAATNTGLYITAIDGTLAGLVLSSGAYYATIIKEINDDFSIKNSTQDTDLIFGINDGGANKTITWDADVDKLKHSNGTFDFDNDHLITTGNLTAGDIDASGDLDVVGHAAFSGASVTALTGLYFFESKNITSAGDNSHRRGIYAAYQVGKTGAADFTGSIAGLATHVSLDDLNDQDWTHATAIRGISIDIDTESSSTGTVTGACGIVLVADFQDAATVTNYYGIIHDTPTVVNNKLTNAYGIYLGDFNTALTLNYAIYTGIGLVHFGDDADVTGNLDVTGVYKVDSTQVVSNRGAAVADATDAASAITQLNALLARCRAHGLITT